MRDRCSQLHCSNGRAGRRCSRDAFAPGSCHGELPDGRRELWRLLAPIPLSPFSACAARATSPRRGEVKVRILVIARSGSDEAIQILAHAALDCFAEFIIGPATSGRTRWLAMTRAVPSSRHVMSEFCLPPRHSRFAPRQSKRERSAERRIQPMPRGTICVAADHCPFGRGARTFGARSPSGALLRLLARAAWTPYLAPGPCFLGRGLRRALPDPPPIPRPGDSTSRRGPGRQA